MQQLAMLEDEPDVQKVPVVVPLPLDGPFTYQADWQVNLSPGQIVQVPFGKKSLTGVVWHGGIDAGVSPKRIKSIDGVVDVAPLPRNILTLVDLLAKETLAARGAILRLAMSVPAALQPGPRKQMIGWSSIAMSEEVPKDRQLLDDKLGSQGLLTANELSKASGITPSRLKRLLDQGWVTKMERDSDELPLAQDFDFRPPRLSDRQEVARLAIAASRTRSPTGQILLEGVPGSGKTEVYFDAIARTLSSGGTTLVLLPEIALSAQWLARFEERFGAPPALWHSGCTAAQRRKTWKDAAKGNVKVLVGTRSALFLPFPRLDLIVIDEEHEPSYKQEDGVIYDARLAARLRASLDGASVILASATPSLETVVEIERVRGEHVLLEESHGTASPPVIDVADMRRRDKHAGFIGPLLAAALSDNLAAGRQSMLFLNRRGYAPLMTCGACGYRFNCGNCTAWLTMHRYRQRLLCHHCGVSQPLPQHCPECGTLDSAVAVGPGVERVSEEIERSLPGARVATVTSDTLTSAGKAAEFIAAMEAGTIDIVVGTQLIAKGHHFPNLTLVGIVDADASLGVSDPRASERCFQLLYQLAGRAGRADLRGRVIIQTRNPDHPVIHALCQGDRSQFLALERSDREDAKLPPFGRLAAFIISGRDHQDVRHLGMKLARNAPREDGLQVLGPAPAPLAMLRGAYRERLLVKAGLEADLPGILRAWLAKVPVPSRLRLAIDIDPQSFY